MAITGAFIFHILVLHKFERLRIQVQQIKKSWLCHLAIYEAANMLMLTIFSLYSLPHNKFLDITKLKAFTDDKLNIAKMTIVTISLCDRVENTVGKEENVDYQHFLLFPQCFPKPSSLGSLKVWIVW